jgi:hypothetical protein
VVEKLLRLTLRTGDDGPDRLRAAGLGISTLGDKTTVMTARFGSQAAKYGLAAGDEITAVLVPTERMSRYWFTIPALLLLAGIILLQIRRRQVFKPAMA